MNHELLKPCPFCGDEAEITRYGTSRVSTIYQCTNCGCGMETGEENNHGECWNERELLRKYEFFINEIKSHINTGHTEITAGWLLDQIKRIEDRK